MGVNKDYDGSTIHEQARIFYIPDPHFEPQFYLRTPIRAKYKMRNTTTNDSFTLSGYWDIFYVSGRAFIVQIQVQIKKILRPPDT
jgi:hypothetical protein